MVTTPEQFSPEQALLHKIASGYDPDFDYGYALHRLVEKHLSLCMEAYEAIEDASDAGDRAPVINDPASGPYDGCNTCDVRETLYISWPVIEEITKQRIVWEARQAS